ncbi:putative Transposase-associated domain-containing protein [Helianthus annuus]|nr:putative Transposase-associated domain-containing protein [Helianthus annuus]
MAWFSNRKWMYEKIDSDGYLNPEYCDNVDLFLDFAFSHEEVVDKMVNMHGETILEIKCPCYKCQNISYRDRATVQKHLYKEGFMLRYEKWSEHGESSICDVGQHSTTMEIDDNDDAYRRMVLDNMYACGYTSNTLEGDVPNPEAKSFYDMLQAADEPLWEGEKATNCSKLQAATSFLTWKSLFNVSIAAYNYNISMVNALLPEENKLPKNFYETKKSLEKLSLPYERIDVCINHCMLFYKQDKTLTQCKYCKESRYKSDRNKVPNLVMSYMPIGPRLKRLYMSTKTAKDMTWHHNHKTMEGSMAHPSDGMAWKHFDSNSKFPTHCGPSFLQSITCLLGFV